MKLSATVQEAVADVQVEISQEEGAETHGQRTYDHAIREFVTWYCSEPRLAFNRTVVLRYRIHLEQRHYAPATINLRLAARAQAVLQH